MPAPARQPQRPTEPLDPAVIRMVDALALAQAVEDHERGSTGGDNENNRRQKGG